LLSSFIPRYRSFDRWTISCRQTLKNTTNQAYFTSPTSRIRTLESMSAADIVTTNLSRPVPSWFTLPLMTLKTLRWRSNLLACESSRRVNPSCSSVLWKVSDMLCYLE
ncbi:hypothetical protein ANCCAN_29271, partial [Ancylostoma caninum]